MEIGELLERLREFIPKIGNWAVNDSVCAGLKLVKKHREETLAFLRPYFAGEAEFEVRFAVVMLMDHYIDETYIDEALSLLRTVRHEGYYVKMAVAWALSVCYVKFPERTRPLLQGEAFDPQTRRMALQKIVESNRVDAREKAEIRALRKAVR